MASRLVLTDACVCVCVSLSLFPPGFFFFLGGVALLPPLPRGGGEVWSGPGAVRRRTCLSGRVLFPAGAGCSELLRTQTLQDSKSGAHVVCFCSVLGDLKAAGMTSCCRDSFPFLGFFFFPPFLPSFIVALLQQTFGALRGGSWWRGGWAEEGPLGQQDLFRVL